MKILNLLAVVTLFSFSLKSAQQDKEKIMVDHVCWALTNRDIDPLPVIESFIARGGNINARGFREHTLLEVVVARAAEGSAEAIRLLCEKGADINGLNGYKRPHLWEALGFDRDPHTYVDRSGIRRDIIEALIRCGADVNAKIEGETTLSQALSIDDACLLIEAGALPDPESLLWILSNMKLRGQQINVADLKRFFDHSLFGPDVLLKDGYPLLMYAAEAGDLENVRYLLDAGANVNAVDESGNTALHVARTLAIARLLIDRGAQIDARNKQGQTPLHAIAQRRSMQEGQRQEVQAIVAFLLGRS